MREGLKACPFCGGGARYIESGYVIKCTGCGAESCIQSREIDCIAAWNRRTPAPMTSVVTWVRTNIHLPEAYRSVLIKLKIKDAVEDECYHLRPNHTNGKEDGTFYFYTAPNDYEETHQTSDVEAWSYLPTPPEADA